MKIAVSFTSGIILECEDVKDRRRFWRNVSKQCKKLSCAINAYCRPILYRERVERVYINDNLIYERGGKS